MTDEQLLDKCREALNQVQRWKDESFGTQQKIAKYLEGIVQDLYDEVKYLEDQEELPDEISVISADEEFRDIEF